MIVPNATLSTAHLGFSSPQNHLLLQRNTSAYHSLVMRRAFFSLLADFPQQALLFLKPRVNKVTLGILSSLFCFLPSNSEADINTFILLQECAKWSSVPPLRFERVLFPVWFFSGLLDQPHYTEQLWSAKPRVAQAGARYQNNRTPHLLAPSAPPLVMHKLFLGHGPPNQLSLLNLVLTRLSRAAA